MIRRGFHSTAWDAAGCDLALTLHHAQEVAQLADNSSRKRRIDLIREFPRVRYEKGGSHKIVYLETLVQVQARLTGIAPDYNGVIREALFLENGVAGVEETVLELGEPLRMMEGAQQLTAQARNATRGTPRPTSYKKAYPGVR